MSLLSFIPLILIATATAGYSGATAPARAEGGQSSSAGKFTVSGDTLVYDTEDGAEESEIEVDDPEMLREILRRSPGIVTLRLNSSGGSVWAGEEMARIVIDFGLDTEIDGECSSSCVMVFLAGDSRRMARGSRLGLHTRWWSPEDVEDYYEDWKEDERWDTPFEYGSWIYKDTQEEVYESLDYIVSRGVEPGFAIKMHAPRNSMWYPTREELERAGVLRGGD